MIRTILAAAAAFALASAAPARACPSCHDCPMHASAEKAGSGQAGKADEKGKAACARAGDQGAAPCGASCERRECPPSGAKPAEKDGGEKKT